MLPVSLVGHLTSSTDLNLVIARNCLLELHLVTPEGLKMLKEITIYGKIACMNLFTPRRTTAVSVVCVVCCSVVLLLHYTTVLCSVVYSVAILHCIVVCVLLCAVS